MRVGPERRLSIEELMLFKLWCWRRLRVLWTTRRSNQSILKEINSECSLEGLMLKLKLQYFGHVMRRANSLEKSWCWARLRAGGEGATKDEMVGWHHWLSEHEFDQTPGDSEGQESLACCSPWGRKESGMTEQLNWEDNCFTMLYWFLLYNNVNQR